MRTCTAFPWRVENGTLALSTGLERDEEDAIATIFTRTGERVLAPYRLGTPDYTFRSQTSPNAIAQKLAIAIEEQCPTIARVIGQGEIVDSGTAIARLYWAAQQTSRVLTLRIS